MGKNCAQAVRSTGRNHEDMFPHLPHLIFQSALPAALLCTNKGSFAAVVRAVRTGIYTGILGRLTVTNRYLSSVSTAPIITTTTYI